ncbi:MAG: hypothetical protein ACW97P_00560 [Candidatus Hodarchaeales archaeon]
MDFNSRYFYSFFVSVRDISNNKPSMVMICHAYQPPNQSQKVLERIVNNCYLPIARMLEDNPERKLTLNINASLSELLEVDYPKVIEVFADLARSKQVEFLESGAYHPILPLLSEKEAKYQIKLNHEINLRIFGSAWHPKGFWPPELAVSSSLLKIIESMNYEYCIVPEISISSNENLPDPILYRIPYYTEIPNLALIYRNKEISNNISFKKYISLNNMQQHLDSIHSENPKGRFYVVATDLETFGEHHQGYEDLLKSILNRFGSQTIDEILLLEKFGINKFRDCSWSTSEEDLYRNIPYPLWAYPGNSIHEILNFHSDLLSETLDYLLKEQEESVYEVRQALKEVAKAQYSCQTWWGSTKDHFSKELILNGLTLQKQALKVTLKAVKSEMAQSVILATSDRLETRLRRYLDRLR